MKTKILSFLFVLTAVLLISTSAYAQPTSSSGGNTTSVTALDGMQTTFTANTGTGTFVWALTAVSGGHAGTTTIAADVTGQTDNSITIKWDAASATDTYKVTTYLTSGGCYSEMLTWNVTINSATIDLVSSPATVCSWLGSASVSGNVSAAADQVVIATTANGGITPATVSYEIKNGAGTVVDTKTGVSVALNSGSITVTIDSKFANISGLNVIFTIKLIGATDASGNVMNVGTTTSAITVNSVPTIAF